MGAVTGDGQYVNTFPTARGPNSYTGVTLAALCNTVGALGPSNVITTVSGDSYVTTLTYDQVVNGNLETFNEVREDSQITSGQTLLLSYKIDGDYWVSDSGPLRLVIINTPSDRYSDSTLWAKNIVRIEIS
ncbi:MAG: hypothetical protein NWF04_02255 [Candidatus Bathyarchaeota archaeon]|nr:hypothetical protein [Candidatus Bathyarchaeota archaeon]